MAQVTHSSRAFEARPRAASYELSSVFRILCEEWRIVVATSLGSALLLFGVSCLLRDQYEATAIVMPPSQNSGALSIMSNMTSGGSSSLPISALAAFGMKTPTDLYVSLMQTPVVEDEIVKQFDLQKLYRTRRFSRARKEFEANSKIKADQKSGLISVSVIDRDPSRAAQMANALVDSFDRLSEHMAISEAARRRLFFEREVDETKKNLTVAENALRDTIKQTGMMEPQGNVRAMIAYEEQIRAQIAAKSAEVQSMKVYLSDENPQVQTATRELQALEAQAASLNHAQSGDASISKYVASDASLEYMRRLREVTYNEALLELLLKNLELAKLDEAREGNLIQVVNPATPPDTKHGPHRSLFFGGGLFLGLLGSVGWILLRRGPALE